MRFDRLTLALALMAVALGGFSCAPKANFEARTYPMGEKVQLGNFVYNVYDSQWLTHVGEGMAARVPDDRFFLVRVSVTNSGSNDAIVPTMSLIDESGKTVGEISNGDQLPGWIGYLRSVKPAESLQGNVAFDCAPRRYKLRIADETEQRTALVDIPLTFASETPEIPSPAIPEKN